MFDVTRLSLLTRGKRKESQKVEDEESNAKVSLSSNEIVFDIKLRQELGVFFHEFSVSFVYRREMKTLPLWGNVDSETVTIDLLKYFWLRFLLTLHVHKS